MKFTPKALESDRRLHFQNVRQHVACQGQEPGGGKEGRVAATLLSRKESGSCQPE